MGRRFCPGGAVVSTLRAVCAEWGFGVLFRPCGRHPCRPHHKFTKFTGLRGGRTHRFIRLTLAIAGAAMLAGTFPAPAKTPVGKATQKAPGENGKMFVEAAELRYDTDKNIVPAEGNARVFTRARCSKPTAWSTIAILAGFMPKVTPN